MKALVLVVLMVVISLKIAHSQNAYIENREDRYDFIYNDCKNNKNTHTYCFDLKLNRWKKHLDSIIIDFKTKIDEINCLEDSKLWKKKNDIKEKFLSSQEKFDNEFPYSIWKEYGIHSTLIQVVYKVIVKRCLDIEDEIYLLEKAVQKLKDEEND